VLLNFPSGTEKGCFVYGTTCTNSRKYELNKSYHVYIFTYLLCESLQQVRVKYFMCLLVGLVGVVVGRGNLCFFGIKFLLHVCNIYHYNLLLTMTGIRIILRLMQFG